MAAEPESLRARRQRGPSSVVDFEADAGALVRRARLFEDGELASESLQTCPRDD